MDRAAGILITRHDTRRYIVALVGAFLTSGGAAAVLGLIGLLHYRERSAVNFLITLFGGATVIWLAVQQVALTAIAS